MFCSEKNINNTAQSPQRMNIQTLIEQARADPTLLHTLNVDELLDNAQSPYLAGQTLESIATGVYQALESIPNISEKQLETLCSKLLEYRFVDEVYQLHRGKHIRWIRVGGENASLTLANGAVVMDTKFLDNGVHIMCRAPRTGRFFQLKWDECCVFQKLSEEERLILLLGSG